MAYALSGCQLVEQELKLYITDALELVKKCIAGRVTFEMNGEDYEDASLERLIEVFGKLSSNVSLLKDLRLFKKQRNFLSHKAIAHCLDLDGELHEAAATDFQQNLVGIQREAERLRTDIHEEAYKFRGILWFGEFPDAA